MIKPVSCELGNTVIASYGENKKKKEEKKERKMTRFTS
jgi:hypothetical protein